MMRLILGLAMLLLAFTVNAKELGPDVAVYKETPLKWEGGPYGYHVMFKSLLANTDSSNDTAGGQYNPQADECLSQSTYTLDASKIPMNAEIEQAFLIWVSTVNPADIWGPTDNAVSLSFVHQNGVPGKKEAFTSSVFGTLTSEGSFEYESLLVEQILEKGSGGNIACDGDEYCKTYPDIAKYTEFSSCINGFCGLRSGYYTYRMDITEFFSQIQVQGMGAGLASGESLLGDYTFSNLDCYATWEYLRTISLTSSWVIVLVYRSNDIATKNLYIYDGFEPYQYKESVIGINGFEFPENPKILITLISNEGDFIYPKSSVSQVAESLKTKGAGDGYVELFNQCNYQTDFGSGDTFFYTEIFNSLSSVYGFDPAAGVTCVGGTPPNIVKDQIEYALDVDTFYVDAAEEPWKSQFYQGGKELSISVGTNSDWVLSNLMIVSHDVKKVVATSDADAIADDADTVVEGDTDILYPDSTDATHTDIDGTISDGDYFTDSDSTATNDNTNPQDGDSQTENEQQQDDTDTANPSNGCGCSLI
jgi:hypothetical protein